MVDTRTRRRRRNAEEKLLEEAREQVFRGTDPKEPESEALALILDNKVKVTRFGRKQQQKASIAGSGHVSSQSQSQRSNSKGQSSSKTAIPIDLNEEMSQMSPPIMKRGRGRPKREQPPVSASNSSQSLALVPVKKNAPTRSTGNHSTLIPVKEAPAAFRQIGKEAPTSIKQINKDELLDRQNNSMNNSSLRFSVSTNLNKDWQEFTQVVEEVVDEVIVNMHNRKEEEKTKKICMKAALLEVIYQQIPLSKTTAVAEKKIGLSTLRRYSTEVKSRLEACLGQQVVDDDFLKQIHNNNRQQWTLGQLRTALMKAGKITQEQGTSSSGKENRKRSQSLATPPTSVPVDHRLALQNATANTIKPADTPTNSTASAAKRSRTTESRQAQKQQSANGIGSQQTGSGDISMILLQPAGNNKELLTRQNLARKRFRGTERQLRKKIFEMAKQRYKGEPETFTDTIYKILVKSREVKLLLEQNDMPQELINMGFRMLHWQYEGVNNPEILPDGESEEEDD